MTSEGTAESSQKQIDDLVSKHLQGTPEYKSPSLNRDSVCETFVEFGAGEKGEDRAGRGIDDLTKFMDGLETQMDSKLGIKRYIVEDAVNHINGEKCSLIIRDARGQLENDKAPHELPESYRILAAGRVRGAMYLMRQCNEGDRAKSYKALRKLFVSYDQQIENAPTESKRNALLKTLDKEIIKVLSSHSLKIGETSLSNSKEAQKLLEHAVDVATLTEKEHPAIVSISADLAAQVEGQTDKCYKITSNIPARPFKDAGKVEEHEWYKQLGASTEPLDKARHALISPVREAFNDGKHIKPTQLSTFTGGIANLQYQSSHFVEANGVKIKGEELEYGLFRSGTCAFARGKHSNEALVAKYTKENVEYKKGLTGGKGVVTLTHESKINAAVVEEDVTQRPLSLSRYNPFQTDFNNIVTFRSELLDQTSEEIIKGKVGGVECKSGKDRTGIQVDKIDESLVKKFAQLRFKIQAKAREAIQKIEDIASRTHDMVMVAGGRGGTRGAFGINGKGVVSLLSGISSRKRSYITKSDKISKSNHISDPPKSKKKPRNLVKEAMMLGEKMRKEQAKSSGKKRFSGFGKPKVGISASTA